jgi:thimet oligopeptidase
MVNFCLLILVLASSAAVAASKPAAIAPAPEASRLFTVAPEAFLSTCRVDMQRARDAMAKLKAMKAPRDPMQAIDAFDDAGMYLGDAAQRAGLLHEVHPSKPMREAGETCEQEASNLGTEFSLDRGLYDAITSLDVSKLDAATKRYVSTTLRDFRRAGVDRDEATRAKVKALREELVKIGQEFSKNIAGDVRRLEVDPADLDGLPEDFKAAHKPGPNGKVVITTNNTDYVPFMDYSKSTEAREELWKLYRQRAHPKNLEVLARMLQKRYELATLLGYKQWADYITEDKMIGTWQNAADFKELGPVPRPSLFGARVRPDCGTERLNRVAMRARTSVTGWRTASQTDPSIWRPEDSGARGWTRSRPPMPVAHLFGI